MFQEHNYFFAYAAGAPLQEKFCNKSLGSFTLQNLTVNHESWTLGEFENGLSNRDDSMISLILFNVVYYFFVCFQIDHQPDVGRRRRHW